MNIEFRPVRAVAVVAVALGLSGASLLTSGSAQASGLGKILEELGIAVAHEAHVSVPVAAHAVPVAVGPAAAAAGEDQTEFNVLMKAACAVNDIWLAGQTAQIRADSPSEHEAILDEANQLRNTPFGTVSAICAFKAFRR